MFNVLYVNEEQIFLIVVIKDLPLGTTSDLFLEYKFLSITFSLNETYPLETLLFT